MQGTALSTLETVPCILLAPTGTETVVHRTMALKPVEPCAHETAAQTPVPARAIETDMTTGGKPLCGRQGDSEAPAPLFYEHFVSRKESVLKAENSRFFKPNTDFSRESSGHQADKATC